MSSVGNFEFALDCRASHWLQVHSMHLWVWQRGEQTESQSVNITAWLAQPPITLRSSEGENSVKKKKRKMCCTIQALRELCIVDHKTVERLILFFSILLIRRDLYPFLDLWQLCFFIQKLTPFSAFAALTEEGWKMSGMTDAEGASRRFVMTWLFYERKNGSWCHVTIFKKRQRYVFVI